MEGLESMKASEIAEKLFEIEKELNLFEKQIHGIYFWKLIRFELYSIILNKLNLISTFEKNKKTTLLNKLVRVFQIIRNTFYFSNKNNRVDIIVFENPRKIKDTDGKYYDPYTKYFVDSLRDKNTNYEIIDLGFNGIHYEKKDSERKYGDHFYYDILKRIIYKNKSIDEKSKEFLISIKNKFFKEFEIEIDFFALVNKHLKRFNIEYSKYYSLLKNKNVKILYLVCSYEKESLIKVANDLNIKVIELQHGTMNKYHIGYSFPDNIKIPYFPDEMLLFGKFWHDNTPIPLNSNQINFIGYKDYNIRIKKFYNIPQKKKITFISQWTLSEQIFSKALEIAKDYPEYEVVFRLHPAEFLKKDIYLEKIKASEYKNLKISDINLLTEELSNSEFVIGVYSTAIYEALSFNCKIILLDLYGIEYMEYLIKKKYVFKIALNEKIVLENITSLKLIDSGYFFGEDND